MAGVTPEDLIRSLHSFALERDRMRTALARWLNISVTDLDALEHLELTGPLPQRDLAARLMLTSGAVTQLVDRLERSSLVTRAPHPTDRRVTLVALAPDTVLPEVPPLDRFHAILHEIAVALPEPVRGEIARFLQTAADHAAEATPALLHRSDEDGA